MIGPDRTECHGVEGWVQDELVRQAQRGDAEAFDSLARMVGDRCLAIAVRIPCPISERKAVTVRMPSRSSLT